MMIITRTYAQRLVKAGKASVDGSMASGGQRWPDHPHYVIVVRHDLQRIDHYEATNADGDTQEADTCTI